jgi:hypothetical protein
MLLREKKKELYLNFVAWELHDVVFVFIGRASSYLTPWQHFSIWAYTAHVVGSYTHLV